ncbi:MAG TPA: SEL1-like repeat protein, partial [Alphaproteobacteria bacterium]|nr:SEL1-like repeat protein [Alphaproteobacteria bacterium]
AAIYTAGHGGVAQDYKKAAAWFQIAAEGGVANAAYNLGVLHHQGIGVKQDLGEALDWYQKAADQGHPEAQYNLGIAHIEGVGLPYDAEKAARYFENAAREGVMEAAYNLGLIYENGLLGEAQPDEALMWYKTAADKGSPEAKAALDHLAKSLNVRIEDVNKLVDGMKTLKSSDTAPAPVPEQRSSVDDAPVPLDPGPSAERTLIAGVQQQLMNFGLYPGPADGLSGPITEDAIRSYQTAYGLPADGQPTDILLSHMMSQSMKAMTEGLVGAGNE